MIDLLSTDHSNDLLLDTMPDLANTVSKHLTEGDG